MVIPYPTYINLAMEGNIMVHPFKPLVCWSLPSFIKDRDSQHIEEYEEISNRLNIRSVKDQMDLVDSIMSHADSNKLANLVREWKWYMYHQIQALRDKANGYTSFTFV